MKRIHLPQKTLGVLVLFSVFLTGSITQQAGALTRDEFYSDNDIRFYDPTAQICTNQEINAAATFVNIPDPWNSLIAQTAPEHPTADPRLVAATLYIENRGWPDYDTDWATSHAGASGPWQFIPSTWSFMGTDGDGDGVKDPNNPKDAVHAAFRHQAGSMGKPIIEGYTGDIEAGLDLTFRRNSQSLLSFMANYNGRGAPNNTKLKDFGRNENSDYVRMAYYVLASNFTQTWDTASGQPVSVTESNIGGGGAATSASICPSGGGASGQVSSEGFSFPVGGVPKEYITNNQLRWPCPDACHHGGSGAFDLFDKRSNETTSSDDLTVGKPVYAIEDAQVTKVRNSYSGQAGCDTITLLGESGWKYWYGHIQNASVKVGQTVSAGQQMAIIGERRCTGNGSVPHLHIDRGPEVGASPGNKDENASKTLVPIINKLYEELPS